MQPAGNPDSSRGCSVLALPPEYAPEFDCLKEGFEIFRQQYGKRLNNQTPLRFLTGLGAKLWQAKLDAVYVFPMMDDQGGVVDFERRLYDDSLILVSGKLE